MDKLKSIVAGVDFTPCSKSALQQAVRIARWNQAVLRVVHVIETEVVRDMESATDHSSEEVKGTLARGAQNTWQEFTADLPDARDYEFLVVFGEPVESLLMSVNQYKTELLVLGTHGNSPADSSAGPTAAECTHKAQTRVLLVEDPHGGPFKKVIACIDFSDTSRKALEQAIRVATQDESILQVLHVFDGPWNHMHYRTETAEASLDFQMQFREGLEQQLREFCQPFEADMRPLTVQYHLLDYTSHGGGITKFALENDADLVVLGTRGKTNLRDLILGSTADRVVKDTPCSILTVKPD